MTDPGDWRDLRSDWQSASLDSAFVAKVSFSLKWRFWLSRAWLASELLASLLLILIIVQNIVVGRFAEAVSMMLFGGACLAGFLWARGVRIDGDKDSLLGMAELAVARSRRTLRLVYGSYAVFLLLLIDRLAREGEFLAGHLAWLALSTAVAAVIHVLARLRLRRFAAIRHALSGSNL